MDLAALTAQHARSTVDLADWLAADPEALDHLDLDGCVRLLAQVADAIDALSRSVKPRLEREALKRMNDKEHEVDGITVTKRQARQDEVWDNKSVVSQVVVHALADRKVNEETGEIEHPAWVTAQSLDRVYGLTDKKSTKPRTTVLSEFLGWDKDELSEYRTHAGWKPPTLQLTRPKREESS